MKIITALMAIVFAGIACSQDTSKIKFIEDGIDIYGKFSFASSGGGDKFVVCDPTGRELIPPGAVLSVIKPYYTLGFYSGKIEVKTPDGVVTLNKIIFELKPEGSLSFYHTSADGSFVAKRIEGAVSFK